MSKQQIKESLKRASRHVKSSVKHVKKAVKISLKEAEKVALNAMDKADKVVKEVSEIEERVSYNRSHKELTGMKLYVVHFVEYIDSKKSCDNPVFFATSPEWAIGFCKFNTNFASKFENDKNRWWYFYIEETTVNEKGKGIGWIATLDWNGSIVNYTYHIDHGYDFSYVKEKVIMEQENDCKECVANEKSEEEKAIEKASSASVLASEEIKNYFKNVKDLKVEVKKEADWFKVIARSEKFKDSSDSFVYKKITEKYCLGVGNKILIYFTAPVSK